MSKKNKNESDVYDIEKVKKHLEEADKIEPDEYTANKMPVYAANVNLRRQIPDIHDGLLPIHRRILMTMYLEGLYKGRFSKSAQVVGSVMKNLHPHGDMSIYSSLILLGQPWRNNISMVARKGNYGSAYDVDGYASSRYTETSMSNFAYDCYFSDWNLKSPKNDMITDWIPNYDDSGLEPMYLPCKYPVFLLNFKKQMGIGLYCSILGFNTTESFNAVIKLIENPKAKFTLYPDDPEGCTLVNAKDFSNSLDATDLKAKFRGTYRVSHLNGKETIEITSTPFEVNPSSITEAIKEAQKKGKLPELLDIDGCSEELGTKFVITLVLRHGYSPESVMTKLYKITQLENTYTMQYNFVNGLESMSCTLRIAILEWIRTRRETLKRINKSRLIWVIKRRFFLEPLIKVIESGQIDEFVKIVRNNSEDSAVKKIMAGWNLTDYQAEKIVDVKISDLSKDKLASYKSELKDLLAEEKELTNLVNNHEELDKLIIKQMKEGIEKYGTPRKSEIVQLIDSDRVEDTNHYLIFTSKYVKKLPYEEKGYRVGKIDIGDKVKKVMLVNNRDTLLLFTRDGRCTPVKVSVIPNSNLQSSGVQLTELKTKSNNFADAIDLSKKDQEAADKYIIACTKKGMITRIQMSEILEKQNSFIYMKLDNDDALVSTDLCTMDDKLIMFSNKGKCTIFDAEDVPQSSFAVKGSIGAKVAEDDEVIRTRVISNKATHIVTLTDRAFVKKINILNMPATKRNGRMVEISSTNGNLVDVVAVNDINESPMFIMTSIGSFVLDHTNITANNRLGKAERATMLDIKDYAFEILYK